MAPGRHAHIPIEGIMILWRRLVWFATVLAGLFVVTFHTYAQSVATNGIATPIEEQLNPDGSLKLGNGFNGSLDPRGWEMTTAPDGSPRFVRSTGGKERGGLLTVPGDEGWDLRFGPAGVNGVVYTVAVSGSDVYVGGRFTVAGGISANNVVRWDSQNRTWNQLGRPDANGVGGAMWAGHGTVNVICVVGDNVYVGGIFESAGDQYIEGIGRWNRTSNEWFGLGSGINNYLEPSGTSRGGDVYAIIPRGSDLIVAGRFFKAGSERIGNVARWDGTRWYSLGAAGDSTNGHIYAVALYNNEIYIGGLFSQLGTQSISNMAHFNVSTNKWSAVDGAPDSTVYAMATADNLLYVGGAFKNAGGKLVNRIATWNGSTWSTLGTAPAAAGDSDYVRVIIPTNNGVVVGGSFDRMGGLIANNVARWSNASWFTLGQGVAGESRTVYALAAAGPKVYGGGSFYSAGTIAARNVALWDSTEWKPLTEYDDPGINRNGTNRGVYAVVLRGSDVYLGGDFTMAGGRPANYVARWNSVTNTWSSLGTGIGGPAPFVRSMAFKGDTLFVGGIFTKAGDQDATGIAKWDGTRWLPVGGGVGGPNPFVFAMAGSGNDLYVAGAFTQAGGTSANRIAKWDGNGWSTLGEGVASDGYSYITSIALSGTDLYVGGDFTRAGSSQASRVAKWSGGTWSGLGSGVNAQVSAVGVGPQGVYVGGDFTSAGSAAVRYFARWSGTAWEAVGTFDGPVRSIEVGPSGDLILGGEFSMVDGTNARGLVSRVGSAWRPFGVSISNGVNGPVRAIALNTQYIYTGGEFSVAGGVRANNIAQWDGNVFSALGSDPASGLTGPVLAIAVRDSSVYVGGTFTSVGGLSTSGIARWTGHTWARVGGGFVGSVRALVFAPNGDLYAGGDIAKAEGKDVHGIAVWNGTTWEAVGGGVGGSFPVINAMAVAGDYLYVGGRFSTAGDQTAHRIARWSLSGRTWLPVGDGIGGSSDFTFVTAMAARNDTVFVGGSFPSAGGVPVNNIARWDGTRWSGVGNGVNSFVYAIGIGQAGQIYAGGEFTMAGEVDVRNIAMFDGTSWQNLAEGIDGKVYSITPGPGGMMYVAGAFSGAGVAESGGILRWDGVRWQGLGSGVSRDTSYGYVAAVGIVGNDVYVGGNFTLAGGRTSLFFGRWNASFSAVPYAPRIRADGAGIAQNQPNPVREETSFVFDLRTGGMTSLKIYDMSGVEVATVADEMMSPGEHRLAWRPLDLPNGVYVYRLRQGESVISRTLVVCR